jgi:CRISPR/Cas system CSM-associated protein Csm3 (group 7 of RAMP superfamily)
MKKICCSVIRAKLATDSPIHIGNGMRTGIIKQSLPYIPGSVLRGALGSGLMRINDDRASKLYSLIFAEESGKQSDIFFKHAYPIHDGCSGTFIPCARTLFSCQNSSCGKRYDTFVPPLRCDKCGKSVKPISGFICDKCQYVSLRPVSMDLVSSSAIDRNNYSAALEARVKRDDKDSTYNRQLSEEKHGLLHTTEIIDRGVKFSVNLVVGSSVQDLVEPLINTLSTVIEDEGIGGGKSRGLGKVHVFDNKVEEITEESIEDSSDNIDAMAKLDFLSPAVITENFKEYDERFLAGELENGYEWCLGSKPFPNSAKITPKQQALIYEVFGGWSLKEGTRRTPALAISAGSSLLYKLESSDTPFRRMLACLEYFPIGRYKSLGYGQLKIT